MGWQHRSPDDIGCPSSDHCIKVVHKYQTNLNKIKVKGVKSCMREVIRWHCHALQNNKNW